MLQGRATWYAVTIGTSSTKVDCTTTSDAGSPESLKIGVAALQSCARPGEMHACDRGNYGLGEAKVRNVKRQKVQRQHLVAL